MKLTNKQKRFVDEYLVDLNATQAALRAGYSQKTADRIGNENLKKLVVQQEIQKRMRDREKRTEITQDKVLNELAAIAFAKGSDFAQVIEEPIVINGCTVTDPVTGQLRTWDVVRITPTEKLPEEKKKAISGIKQGKNGIEVSSCDKVRALELLGKHLGMFTDKIKLEGSMGVKIVDDIEDDPNDE